MYTQTVLARLERRRAQQYEAEKRRVLATLEPLCLEFSRTLTASEAEVLISDDRNLAAVLSSDYEPLEGASAVVGRFRSFLKPYGVLDLTLYSV